MKMKCEGGLITESGKGRVGVDSCDETEVLLGGIRLQFRQMMWKL